MKGNNIFASTIIFSILTFAQPAIQFFLLPVYLKYFSVEEYGIYTLMNNITMLIAIIGSFSIFSAIFPYYYELKYNRNRLISYLGNILGFSVLSNFILWVIIMLLGHTIFTFVFENNIAFFPYGAIAITTGSLMTISQPYLVFIKNEKKIFQYAIIFLAVIMLTVATQIYFIIFKNYGIYGALLGRMIAVGVGVIIVTIINLKVITFRFNTYFIIKSLRFSLPLMPFLIVSWLQRFGDRFIFEKHFDLSTLGVYSLLCTITLLISMASDAITSGTQPFLFEFYQHPRSNQKKINTIYGVYIMLMLLFTSSIIVAGAHIELFISNPAYANIIKYIFVAPLVFFSASYIQLFRLNLVFYKKSKLLSYISTFWALVIIVLYLLLIPKLQIWGAILTGIICNSLWSISMFYFSKKSMNFNINIYKFLITPLIGITIILGFFFLCLQGSITYQKASIIQFLLILTGVSLYIISQKNQLLKLK